MTMPTELMNATIEETLAWVDEPEDAADRIKRAQEVRENEERKDSPRPRLLAKLEQYQDGSDESDEAGEVEDSETEAVEQIGADPTQEDLNPAYSSAAADRLGEGDLSEVADGLYVSSSPIEMSGLSGVSQDTLNPAFAAPAQGD